MDKAPDAFRTISEVADELDVPQHVLRFWETRFGQIRPMKRGGGRRYYRPDDVDLLRGIRYLLYGEGYTIRGVQGQIKEKGLKYVQDIWKQDVVPLPGRAAAGGADGADRSVEVEVEAEAEEAEEEAPEPKAERVKVAAPPVRATPILSPASRATPIAPVRLPNAAQPSRPTGAPAVGAEELDALRAALSELSECRRILDAVLKDAD